jgi:hypothetical protein
MRLPKSKHGGYCSVNERDFVILSRPEKIITIFQTLCINQNNVLIIWACKWSY